MTSLGTSMKLTCDICHLVLQNPPLSRSHPPFQLSYSAIARRVGCSNASVGKTLKLFDELEVFSRQRSGRPRCTTCRDDIAMLKAIKKQPFLSASGVKKEGSCVKASLRTVRRHLCDEFNLRSRHAARKPLLNSKQVTDNCPVVSCHVQQ